MFHQLTILKSILVAIMMIKHHPHLDMVRILIFYYLLLLLLVRVQSNKSMETNKNSSNYGENETTFAVHSVSIGGTVIMIMKYYISNYIL